MPGQHAWQPAIAPAPDLAALPRQPCHDRSEFRNAYFGDLHVHTKYSWDGAGRGIYTTPDQAYRFARGEPLGILPYDDTGRGLRTVQLERPLDFAAVTDHAEYIGEVHLCVNPDFDQFDSNACRAFRGEEKYRFFPKSMSPTIALRGNARGSDMCGEDGLRCRGASRSAWREMQEAAEDWYDRSSDCSFTTFHGYEYTWAPAANRVHRNVIFRNEVIPELPVSSIEETEPEGLWRRLKELCLDTRGDCDVLSIPHNPNHSSGRMFPLSDPSRSVEERRAIARLAAEMEPLVEMMQIKGESECRNGLWGVTGAPDEFCDLEKYTPVDSAKDCGAELGFGKSLGFGCVSRHDYARYAIAAGMAEERELGVNPYRLGFIGSTDTHNGTAGDVEEWGWEGSIGRNDESLEKRLSRHGGRNPGGLVGVWAEENSRDALFDAMRRREVFATSGPRMTMRFFGSWSDFSDQEPGSQGVSWCDRTDALAAAYASGVPMGGKLAEHVSNAPFFAVHAWRDPGTSERPGGLLERVQIVKVIAKEDGDYHQEVFDVAGGASKANVNPDTCEPIGPGASDLCAVWQDPNFDPAQSAAYYVRVIENPSCRWTTWSCLAAPESDRPSSCDGLSGPPVTQERAWSSPIWYVSD